jgi:hypothetical protein
VTLNGRFGHFLLAPWIGLGIAVSGAGARSGPLSSEGALSESRGNGAGLGELSLQGPWAYTERFDEQANAVEYMAATPAREDADTWLLLACAKDQKVNAAVMHIGEFPFPVHDLSSMLLRATATPAFAVELTVVRSNHLGIAPPTAQHLLPLFIESQEVVAFIPQKNGPAWHYTFSLQPNDRALGGIANHCIP